MNLPAQLSDLYKHLCQSFTDVDMPTAERDARWIVQVHTGHEWSDIIARPEEAIDSATLQKIEQDLQRRLDGEPISRIYGEREFWGLKFRICPDTLDPRPDTETIIEQALERFKERLPETILDLGTGSGCVLIALLSEFKEAQGIGIDKSQGALKTARYNAQNNAVEGRAQFFCGDWGSALGQSFDLIVSNPPYISNQVIPTLSREVQNHDPILALDGGKDGLDAYKKIFSEIKSYLKPGGTGLFEIGFDQQKDVMRLAEESGLSVRHVHHDLAGQPRVVDISSGDK